MNNTGGLNKMFICPISNLSKDGKIISRDKLINIPFTYDTGERSCSYKEDKKGKYYDLQIKCQIPRSDKAEELIKTFPLLYVLITIDTNGISRLEGNKE